MNNIKSPDSTNHIRPDPDIGHNTLDSKLNYQSQYLLVLKNRVYSSISTLSLMFSRTQISSTASRTTWRKETMWYFPDKDKRWELRGTFRLLKGIHTVHGLIWTIPSFSDPLKMNANLFEILPFCNQHVKIDKSWVIYSLTSI